VVRDVDSEDEEEEDDDDAEEADAMDVDEDSEDNDVDAEGDEDEDMDAEGDEDDDMEDTPAPRIVVNTSRSIPVKPAPAIKLTKAPDSVAAKEMAMDDDDDDELSDPDSDLDDEDEDAEGEEDDEMGVTPVGAIDEEMDSDEDLSRDQTPDMSKMTLMVDSWHSRTRRRRRSISRPRNTLCVGRRWHVVGRTFLRRGTRRRRYARLSTSTTSTLSTNSTSSLTPSTVFSRNNPPSAAARLL
jgi:hypothetical protein